MTKAVFEVTVRILVAETDSLQELALLSERNAFSFYNGADLTGIDVSGQDLRGLNFSGADLRFSLLDGIKFDRGAFNGSEVDARFASLKDNYEFFLEDLVDFPSNDLLAFARIRPELVDDALHELSLSYSLFAEKAKISQNALRKTRNGQVVALETARSVMTALVAAVGEGGSVELHQIKNRLMQPIAELLHGGNSGSFKTLTRTRLTELLIVRDFRKAHLRSTYPASMPQHYIESRDTAESLGYYELMMKKELGSR